MVMQSGGVVSGHRRSCYAHMPLVLWTCALVWFLYDVFPLSGLALSPWSLVNERFSRSVSVCCVAQLALTSILEVMSCCHSTATLSLSALFLSDDGWYSSALAPACAPTSGK